METIRETFTTQIPTEDIAPNPHNPRRLFDEEPMQILKESIRKLGLLTAVTVYPSKTGKQKYTLLDGERRWRCAKELGLEAMPANIVKEPTELENVLTMFHIHNAREGWQLMPTALKLQTLMKQLEETNERKLSELTKLSVPQIRRCKILLTYPKRFQDLMLAPPSERLKADFFIELHHFRGPALRDQLQPWVDRGDAKVTQILLDKYEKKVISAVTEFRRLAEVYSASTRIGKKRAFIKEFSAFLDDPSSPIDAVAITGATFAKEAKEISRSARRLLTQLQELDLEMIASDEATISILRRLAKLLDKKLNDALLIQARDATPDKD